LPGLDLRAETVWKTCASIALMGELQSIMQLTK